MVHYITVYSTEYEHLMVEGSYVLGGVMQSITVKCIQVQCRQK